MHGKSINFGSEWKSASVHTEHTGNRSVFYTTKTVDGKKLPVRIMIREDLIFSDADTMEAMKAIAHAYRTFYNPKLNFTPKLSYVSYGSYDGYDSTALEIDGWREVTGRKYWVDKLTGLLN